jgi:hypothetical protein
MAEHVKGLTDDDDEVEEVDTKTSKKKSKTTDLMKMTGNLLSNINYKVAFLLFVSSMIIFSDVFIDNVLSEFSDTVDGECATTKGTMLQLLFMVLAYILLDLVVHYELL